MFETTCLKSLVADRRGPADRRNLRRTIGTFLDLGYLEERIVNGRYYYELAPFGFIRPVPLDPASRPTRGFGCPPTARNAATTRLSAREAQGFGGGEREAPTKHAGRASPLAQALLDAYTKYIQVISAGCEPMIERILHGHRLWRSKNS